MTMGDSSKRKRQKSKQKQKTMKQSTPNQNHETRLSNEKEDMMITLNKKTKAKKKKPNMQTQPEPEPEPEPQTKVQSQNGSSINGNNSNDEGSVVGATSSQKRRQRRKREFERQNQSVSINVTSSKTTKQTQEWNPLQETQEKFLQRIPTHVKENFFNDNVVTTDERAKWWELQSDIGIECINQYAWATPHTSLLKIFEEFSPIIEIGCGKNAYWAHWMIRNSTKNIIVNAYDVNPNQGGQILMEENSKNKKRKKNKINSSPLDQEVKVLKGGPKVLSQSQYKDYTLFLCYPDEEENLDENNDESSPPKSMGYQCLEEFQGSYIIHVGELYGHNTYSLDSHQHPWGRSSSVEFQLQLQRKFHCLFQIKLPNQWLHTSDTLTIWKRSSQICEMIFEHDDSESEDDENESGAEDVIQYKHVPVEEQLPLTMAAPCLQHLLPKPSIPASTSRITSTNQDINEDEDDDPLDHDGYTNEDEDDDPLDHDGSKSDPQDQQQEEKEKKQAKSVMIQKTKTKKKRSKLQESKHMTNTKSNGTTEESNSNKSREARDKEEEEKESNDDDDDSDDDNDDDSDSDSDDSMIGPKW